MSSYLLFRKRCNSKKFLIYSTYVFPKTFFSYRDVLLQWFLSSHSRDEFFLPVLLLLTVPYRWVSRSLSTILVRIYIGSFLLLIIDLDTLYIDSSLEGLSLIMKTISLFWNGLELTFLDPLNYGTGSPIYVKTGD